MQCIMFCNVISQNDTTCYFISLSWENNYFFNHDILYMFPSNMIVEIFVFFFENSENHSTNFDFIWLLLLNDLANFPSFIIVPFYKN